jgi:hypothetical protein
MQRAQRTLYIYDKDKEEDWLFPCSSRGSCSTQKSSSAPLIQQRKQTGRRERKLPTNQGKCTLYFFLSLLFKKIQEIKRKENTRINTHAHRKRGRRVEVRGQARSLVTTGRKGCRRRWRKICGCGCMGGGERERRKEKLRCGSARFV